MDPMNTSIQSSFSQSEGRINQLKNAYLHPGDKDHDKLKKAAQDFESVFITQLMTAMDKTVDRSGLLNGGNAEEMFRGMMNEEVAKRMATRPGGSGFGLAEAIYKQLAGDMKATPLAPQSQAAPGVSTIQKEG